MTPAKPSGGQVGALHLATTRAPARRNWRDSMQHNRRVLSARGRAHSGMLRRACRELRPRLPIDLQRWLRSHPAPDTSQLLRPASSRAMGRSNPWPIPSTMRRQPARRRRRRHRCRGRLR